MTDAPDLKPCPFCGGTNTSIEPMGQIWRGVKGYSDPQYYVLVHHDHLPQNDGRAWCYIKMTSKTEADVIEAWNTRTDLAQAQIKEAREQALIEAASVVMDKWEDIYNPDCGEAVKGILALIENGEG